MLTFFQNSTEVNSWDPPARRKFFLLYSACFCIVALGVLSWFCLAGRTLIWKNDAWAQHYRVLVYYGSLLRSILKGILKEGKVVIPNMSFSIGEGSDILKTLHYYAVGDPLNLLSVFFPTRYMWVCYGLIILIRIYLAGFFFSRLCMETGLKNLFGILCGALSYAFCTWVLIQVNRHTFFLTPVMCFPFILLGVEKILRRRRPWTFIGAVFLAGISQFYFFYMEAILTVVYVVVRLCFLHGRDIRKIAVQILWFALYAVLGAALGAVVLLPVLSAFLGSSRMTVENGTLLLYPLSYYTMLPGMTISISSDYWSLMGYSVPTVPAVILLLLRKREHRPLKVFLLISCVILCLPALGSLLNGMSYISNRWCWALALLCAYILAAMWPDMLNMTDREKKIIFVVTVAFALICALLDNSRTLSVFMSFTLLFITLMLLKDAGADTANEAKRIRLQSLILAVTAAGIWSNSYNMYSSDAHNYASTAVDIEDAENINDNEAKAVKMAAGEDEGSDGFWRYTTEEVSEIVTNNTGLTSNLFSTGFYFSIANGNISDFRTSLGINEPVLQDYCGYDNREALMALAGTRYYVCSSQTENAAGYYGYTYLGKYNVSKSETKHALAELSAEENGTVSDEQKSVIQDAVSSIYYVYRNDLTLPLGYTYSSTASRSSFEELNEVEKQEVMLQQLVLEDEDAGGTSVDAELTDQSLDYTVTCLSSDVTRDGNSFIVTSANSSVTLDFNGLPDSELYLLFHGLSYEPSTTYELYFGDDRVDPLNLYNRTRWKYLDSTARGTILRNRLLAADPTSVTLKFRTSAGRKKSLRCDTPYYNFYSGRDDFAVNLQYSEDAVTSVTITFPSTGIYSFDSMEVVCQPMDTYADRIEALKQDTPEDLMIRTDIVEGTINAGNDEWLCLSIPYADGWTAWVDGQKTKLYRANLQYMAVHLSAGEHTVRLTYCTPYLKAGAAVTGISALLLSGIVILPICRRKRKGISPEQDPAA